MIRCCIKSSFLNGLALIDTSQDKIKRFGVHFASGNDKGRQNAMRFTAGRTVDSSAGEGDSDVHNGQGSFKRIMNMEFVATVRTDKAVRIGEGIESLIVLGLNEGDKESKRGFRV